MLTNNYLDSTTNKVYINPNFNRNPGNSLHSNTAMHINPRFSHLLSNVQPNLHSKAKIYVNPNFVKSTKSSDSLEFITNANINNIYQKTDHNPSSVYHHNQPKIENETTHVAIPIAKSRYSLVRHNTTKVLNREVVEKSRNTYQVNKYKSIPLKDIKRNLEYSNKPQGKLTSLLSCTQSSNAVPTNKKYSVPLTSNTSTKQFKLVNYKNIGAVARHDKIKIKSEIDAKKLQLLKLRLKRCKGNLKKNNIPCPTFRKFGKCLRKIRGKCEFLHDKKHVSVCRKFIKGLCHDKECLLSHDLTTKKMPTCYFYLQGTCTKPDCPYLHVKLSEKVKICPDFLKGYCEKGSKCLLRHSNIQSDKTVLIIKSSRTLKNKYGKVKDKCLDQKSTEIRKRSDNSTVTEKAENNSDCRYYQEQKVDNASDKCEIIKPMRCKLGTLPSFIQL